MSGEMVAFENGVKGIALNLEESSVGVMVLGDYTRIEEGDTVTATGELLRAHASLLASWMQKSGFRNGCPITTVLLELAPRERAVTEAGRKAYAARLAILSRKLVEDGFVKARADALAVLCTSALQGALIQARVERSGRPIEITAAELARLLEAEAKS